MLKHAGVIARELFQDSLFAPVMSSQTTLRVEAVVPIRDRRETGTQELLSVPVPSSFVVCRFGGCRPEL
jgi:hypothetical protein